MGRVAAHFTMILLCLVPMPYTRVGLLVATSVLHDPLPPQPYLLVQKGHLTKLGQSASSLEFFILDVGNSLSLLLGITRYEIQELLTGYEVTEAKDSAQREAEIRQREGNPGFRYSLEPLPQIASLPSG